MSTFSQSTRDYLDAHAIDPALAATVGVHERAGQLRFPNVAPDGSIYHRERSLNGGPKVTQPKGQPLDLWWPLGRRDTEAAIICEGESDALAALEPLSKSRFAALEVASVPGTGYMVERLVEQLAEAGTREVFLAFDGDTAGRAYTAKAEAALRDAGIRSIVVDLEDGTDLADNLVRAADRTRWIENALADAEATVDETESSPAGLEPSSPSPRANTPAWPDPPAEAAFHGLAGDIVRTIEPHSEADPAALLVSLLAAFGNACRRGPGFQVEGDFHATHLYVVIVGATAKGRKGISWGQVRRLFAAADPEWMGERTAGGLTSGEGLIYHVRDPESKQVAAKGKDKQPTGDYVEEIVDAGVDDKRLFVFEGELAQVLKVMGREGNTVSPVIRDLWDRGDVRTLSKKLARPGYGRPRVDPRPRHRRRAAPRAHGNRDRQRLRQPLPVRLRATLEAASRGRRPQRRRAAPARRSPTRCASPRRRTGQARARRRRALTLGRRLRGAVGGTPRPARRGDLAGGGAGRAPRGPVRAARPCGRGPRRAPARRARLVGLLPPLGGARLRSCARRSTRRRAARAPALGRPEGTHPD